MEFFILLWTASFVPMCLQKRYHPGNFLYGMYRNWKNYTELRKKIHELWLQYDPLADCIDLSRVRAISIRLSRIEYRKYMDTKLFSDSISQGCMPKLWKRSYVTPIYKSEEKHNIENYRPISIMSTIPELLDLIMAEKITSMFHSQIISVPWAPGHAGVRWRESPEGARRKRMRAGGGRTNGGRESTTVANTAPH